MIRSTHIPIIFFGVALPMPGSASLSMVEKSCFGVSSDRGTFSLRDVEVTTLEGKP